MPPKQRKEPLPPYVYKRKHGYVLRIYVGKGQPMKSVTLCQPTASISDVWRAYEEFKKEKVKNLRWLLFNYKESDQFKKLALKTQRDRSGMMDRIVAYKTKNGKHFGDAEISKLTSGVMRKYLDARARDGSPVAGNRELAIISVAWNWALERDYILSINPCKVVKPNPETARTRYATEDEYQAVYNIAPDYIKQAMELAYLCRMRRGEILNATRAQILEEGFHVIRTKGSRDSITKWSGRLQKAVKIADGVSSIYVLHDAKGQKIGEEAFKSAWRRLKLKMKDLNIEPFNFHDIKAAGVSDAEGGDYEKMDASGHKDLKTMRIYDRKTRVVKPTK